MTACDFKHRHSCTWLESERFIVTMKDAGMEMKMRRATMVIRKKRLMSPASDGERRPYLSKLDKGIAPDPLPRIPPFLPERSFSTRATFPVRAASSSSWSFPMARDRAAPAHPAAQQQSYDPGHRGPPSPQNDLPSPAPASEPSRAEIPAVPSRPAGAAAAGRRRITSS